MLRQSEHPKVTTSDVHTFRTHEDLMFAYSDDAKIG